MIFHTIFCPLQTVSSFKTKTHTNSRQVTSGFKCQIKGKAMIHDCTYVLPK